MRKRVIKITGAAISMFCANAIADTTNANALAEKLSSGIPYIIFFGASAAIIAISLYFYLKTKNTRRFLTTMRLSVLDRTVQQACRYIEKHFRDPKLSTSEVCRELVTGEAYLNTLFTKELGTNVQDFITQVRIDGIKFFLTENHNQDIDKICAECGFENRAAAEKAFMRLYSTSISEYANALKQK